MQKFYFACKDNSGGVLSGQSPAEAGAASYTYDPVNPVPSVAGTLLGNYRDPFGQPECSTIMMAVGERTDVLSFVSDPLEQDLHVTGAMAAHLFVSSSAAATAFTVCVMEMRPDGTSVNIRDDITDIRWPDENTKKHYVAGSVVDLSLRLLDVSWMLGAGSRLRVDISSSNFPAYHVHPNTEEPWSKATEQVKAIQTIHCGGDYPSRIELPVK